MSIKGMKLAAVLLLLTVTACTSRPAGSDELAWGTFNVRYDNAGDGNNRWDMRKERVCRFINERHLDVVGLQEVLHRQMGDLRAGLPDYDAVGVGRNDGRTRGEYAPIFYRKARYEVVDWGTFWLSETPERPSKGWDAADIRLATWAKLRDKASQRQLLAVNTHFDHIGTVARRESARLLLDSLRVKAAHLPVVVTGDFNVADTSEAYRLLTTDRFPLTDAHKAARETAGAAYSYHDFTRIPPERCEKIDFIFVSPDIEVLRSEVTPETPDSLLSDHNPQWAKLRLTPRP